jgi:hypothetical protein
MYLYSVKKHILFLGILVGLLACNPSETDWDVEALAPIMHSRMTLQNLVGDSSVAVDPDGQLVLEIQGNALPINLDTLSAFRTLAVNDTFYWDYPAITIYPGIDMQLPPIYMNFMVPNAEMVEALMEGGRIDVAVSSSIPRKMNFKYSIPMARLNGQAIGFSGSLAAWVPGQNPVALSRSFDLAGHRLDLRGLDLKGSNRLEILVLPSIAAGETPLNVQQGQALFTIATQFKDMDPLWLRGAFLPQELSIPASLTRIPELSKLSADAVQFEQARVVLRLENTLGAELKVRPRRFWAERSESGLQVDLQHDIINKNLWIDRAVWTGGGAAPAPKTYTYEINNQNSNILDFLSALPDEIGVEVDVSINPLGNTAGFMDFIYPDALPKFSIDARLPMKFSAQNLAFTDTVAWTLKESDYKALNNATLWLKGETLFPFETRLLIELLDANRQVLDTLIQNLIVPAGQPNPNTGIVEQAVAFNQSIEVSEAKLGVLKQTAFVKLKAFLNTPPGTNLVSMKSHYYMDFRLVARAGVNIGFNR